MRKYEEMIAEFASLNTENRKEWFKNLTLEEIEIFRIGFRNAQDWIKKYWMSYIDSVISEKILEIRNDKLKDLGI